MQPIASHQGATSIGGLGERDMAIRDMFEKQRLQAIVDEYPVGYTQLPEGSRVFRTQNKKGFKHVYSMKRKVFNGSGDVTQEASHKFIEFKESEASGLFGELILRPDTTMDFEEKLQVVERLMKDPNYAWVGIVDWAQLRAAQEESEVERQAAAMADPSWLQKVAAKARRMGISLTDGFGDDKPQQQRVVPIGASE